MALLRCIYMHLICTWNLTTDLLLYVVPHETGLLLCVVPHETGLLLCVVPHETGLLLCVVPRETNLLCVVPRGNKSDCHCSEQLANKAFTCVSCLFICGAFSCLVRCSLPSSSSSPTACCPWSPLSSQSRAPSATWRTPTSW
jgi:hypothetical protein